MTNEDSFLLISTIFFDIAIQIQKLVLFLLVELLVTRF